MSGMIELLRHGCALGAVAWALAPAMAAAQDVPKPTTAPAGDAPQPVPTLPAAVDGAKTYTPADFARFAPRTAVEMLRRVPGFPLPEGNGETLRGLGQASVNVLINGQRLSGKSNDVLTELGRIAADNVVRIEIVDGATLDVPGLTGQVANIVTSGQGRTSGTFAWRPQFRAERTKPRLLSGELAVNGKLGGIDYTLAIENQQSRNGNAGRERVFTPDGTILDLRDETLFVTGERPKISGSFRRTASNGAIANLNASVQRNYVDIDETSFRFGPGQIDRDRRLHEQERETSYEVGGDYEFGLGGGRLKLVGLRRSEHSPYEQVLTVAFANGAPGTGDRFAQIGDEAETIARGEYRWKAGGADWQISAEGARNTLDVDNRLFALGAGGVFVPVPLPDAAARVAETRGEAILSYGRPLSSQLTLQASAGAEVSRLSQDGAGGLTRQFVRPKGSVALAWKPSPRLDVSVRIERKVGQLDFFDFVASSNLSAETGNSGNANLVPQQSWEAELQGVRNLGPWGTVTARGYGRLISDIVDVVPIGATGQAPGNLDRAYLFGGQFKGTANLDPAGMKGARIDFDVQVQHSSLTDPVTGAHRPINETLQSSVNTTFRYDVPRSDWAYGASYEAFTQTASFRLDQRLRFINSPGNFGLFIEHKDVFGMTVRGAIDNLLETNEALERDFYDGRRTRALLFTERRDRFYGPVFSFAVTGKL